MERRQLTLFSIIFLAMAGLLTFVYFAFFRTAYGILYENIRETDAAAIVAELDKQSISYRLEDDGHRVLVPEADVGKARVLIAGSGIAMGGVVGFELFNETDMGLTEFAQKVNYQRALQGELARTIMAMDGVRFARVHLSLPERSLFRANQQGPKAAVTVQTQPGVSLGTDRVAGIQQLVASAVTALPTWQVAVLDHRGRLLSAAAENNSQSARELSEKQALEEYYRARAQGVAERLIPGLPFRIRVLAVDRKGADTPSVPAGSKAPADKAERPEAQRDFSLRIAFRTEAALNAEDTALLRDAITDATSLSEDRGDMLRFEIGSLDQPSRPAPDALSRSSEDSSPPSTTRTAPSFAPVDAGAILFGRLFWFTLALLAVMLLILMRRRSRMTAEQQQSFADMLNESIAERTVDGR